MHGMINKSIQGFLCATHGDALWEEVRLGANIPAGGFETLLRYDDEVTDQLIAQAALRLGVDEGALLEDVGHFLVTEPRLEPVRRLLRFGGNCFEDFLQSLDDLTDRAQMAVPDLDMPRISLMEQGGGNYAVVTTWARPGAGMFMMGVMRAMADDYGAFVFVEFKTSGQARSGWREVVTIQLLDHAFADGRSFQLWGQT